MSKNNLPYVKGGLFYTVDDRLIREPISLDSIAWYQILEQIDSFVYEKDDLYLTVRSEYRRAKRYWYGYRRVNGKLKKVYLGNSKALNSATLESKAARLISPSSESNLTENLPVVEQERSQNQSDKPVFNHEELLLAKLRIPAIPQRMVLRLRLTKQLRPSLQLSSDRHHQRRSKPLLTTVIAPSGYGKSTLLSEWVQTVPNLHVAWLSLEEEDDDLYQFWRYLTAALQLALKKDAPSFASQINIQLQGIKLPPIRTIIKKLLNEIQKIDQNMALVLDDFHLIQSHEIHQSLIYFITHCPARLHLFITSRPPFPFPLGQLYTQCDITEISYDELKLTAEETLELLSKFGHDDEDLVQQLFDKTGGWVTGINLILLAMTQNPSDTLRILEKEQRYFTDYFISNVLQQQPEQHQRFLLQTAYLDNFSIELIEHITDFQKGEIGRILASLAEKNLFLIPLNKESGWFRYHHLFANALRRIAAETYPDDLPNLHQKAAEWYIKSDQISQAIQYLISAKCWDQIADLLQDHGVSLLHQGKLTQLIRWLQCIPEDVVSNYPTLLTLYARVLMLTGDVMVLEVWLNHLESASNNPSLQSEVEQIRMIVHGIEENPNTAEGDWWGSLDALTLSINLWSNGQMSEAVVAAQRAIETGRAAGNDATVLLAASNIAFIYILTDQLNKGLQFAFKFVDEYGLTEAQILAGKPPSNLAISPLIMAIGCALYERNQLEKGLAYLEYAKDLCEQLGRVDYLAGAYVLIARTLSALDQKDKAFAQVKLGLELASGSKLTFWPSVDVRAYQAWIWLHFGKKDSALAWLNERAFDLNEPPPQEYIISYWVSAEILVMSGRFEQAIVMFEHLKALSNRGIRTEPESKIDLVYAIALAGAGQQSAALEQLENVLDVAYREGMLRHFFAWRNQARLLLTNLLSKRELSSLTVRFTRLLIHQLETSNSENAATLSLNRLHFHELTPREFEILALLAQRLTNREISEKLIVSSNTVKSHLSSIFRKLDVNQRESAIARYQSSFGYE